MDHAYCSLSLLLLLC